MKKIFRIIDNPLSEEGTKAFHPLWYKVEQKHYILFGLVSWWGTPYFAPPHYFENDCDAIRYIKEQCPNSVVYDGYSENKQKRLS